VSSRKVRNDPQRPITSRNDFRLLMDSSSRSTSAVSLAKVTGSRRVDAIYVNDNAVHDSDGRWPEGKGTLTLRKSQVAAS
jgi:hypothetical protein